MDRFTKVLSILTDIVVSLGILSVYYGSGNGFEAEVAATLLGIFTLVNLILLEVTVE